MTIQELVIDLKNRKFKPVYLLQGEESYYIDKISDYIEHNVLTDAEKGFNQTVLYGKDTDVMTILNSAKRFPMMSEYQVILIKEAQDLKWDKDGDDDKKLTDPLLSYLENPLRSTILVFCYKYGKLDKRKKAYKAIDKNGLVYESAQIYENQVAAWIDDFVADKNYRIHDRASALLAEYLGRDLSKIANELEKLMLNSPPGSEISITNVQDNIGISKDYNIFELQKALIQRDVLKANRILTYFAANPKNNPIIPNLTLLFGFFSKLLVLHQAGPNPNDGVYKSLGIMNSYAQRDFQQALRAYPPARVTDIIHLIRRADAQSKGIASGSMDDGEILRELVWLILHAVPAGVMT